MQRSLYIREDPNIKRLSPVPLTHFPENPQYIAIIIPLENTGYFVIKKEITA